jgi:hypothetical protein
MKPENRQYGGMTSIPRLIESLKEFSKKHAQCYYGRLADQKLRLVQPHS